jgi:sugar phosphate isomerase/epimerase
MKFAICNEIFKDWSFPRTFEYCAKLGYDAVEIAPFTIRQFATQITPQERAEIKQAAANAGITISGIHWVLVQAEGMHMTHPDPAVREQTRDYFVELVNLCSDLGGNNIIVGSPKQRSLMEGVSREQGWEWATAAFKPAVKRAEDTGITLCIEPLSTEETNFINTAKEATEFAHELQSPAMKIILDVKAMCSEGRPVPDIIRESKGEFAYFHANDRNLKGPGFGDVDFQPIAVALKDVGYDGYVSVEVFKFEEGPEAIASRSLEYLKKVFT